MDQRNKDVLMGLAIEAVADTMRATQGSMEAKCQAALTEFPGLPTHILAEARYLLQDEIEAPFWEAMAARLNFQPRQFEQTPPAQQGRHHLDDDIPF